MNDRERLIELLDETFEKQYDRNLVIAARPTADYLISHGVTVQKHGRWVSVPHKAARVCSVCNRDEPYKFADNMAKVYDYCPHCGAKMDGEANGRLDS